MTHLPTSADSAIQLGIFLAIAVIFFGRMAGIVNFNRHTSLSPVFPDLHVQPSTRPPVFGCRAFLTPPIHPSFVLMGGATLVAQILAIEYNVALFFLTIIIAIFVIMGGLAGIMYTDALHRAQSCLPA